jgi:phosphate:Na+ symporter
MLEGSLALLSAYNKPRRRDVMYIEMVVDNLQAEITKYLWHISCGELSPPVAKKLFAFAAMVYDIERMGDHAINLVELSESKFKRKAEFSIAATVELKEIEKLVVENLADASALIAKKDTALINAIGNRAEDVEFKVRAAIEKHLERFYQKLCRAEAGPIFVDMLINLERISEHCRTIAVYIRGLDDV